MSGREQPERLKLRRLEFVRSFVLFYVDLIVRAYKTARGLLPGFVDQQLRPLEEQATATAAPVIEHAQDKAADMLAFADAQVDWVLNYLSSLLDYNLKLHGKNASSFQSAREFAFGTVQGYVDQIKATFDPQGIVEAMVDTLKRLASTAVSYADPDKVVDAATSWYNYLTSYNLVLKVVELVDPLITVGQSQYYKAHDALVVQPTYKKLYDGLTVLPGWVAENPLFRLGYPLVAPLADPLYSTWAHSRVIHQLQDHLKPKSA